MGARHRALRKDMDLRGLMILKGTAKQGCVNSGDKCCVSDWIDREEDHQGIHKHCLFHGREDNNVCY